MDEERVWGKCIHSRYLIRGTKTLCTSESCESCQYLRFCEYFGSCESCHFFSFFCQSWLFSLVRNYVGCGQLYSDWVTYWRTKESCALENVYNSNTNHFLKIVSDI